MQDEIAKLKDDVGAVRTRLTLGENKIENLENNANYMRERQNVFSDLLQSVTLKLSSQEASMGTFTEGVKRREDLLTDHSKAISALISDMRLDRWKVGTIIAVFLFLANQLADRIKF